MKATVTTAILCGVLQPKLIFVMCLHLHITCVSLRGIHVYCVILSAPAQDTLYSEWPAEAEADVFSR